MLICEVWVLTYKTQIGQDALGSRRERDSFEFLRSLIKAGAEDILPALRR